MKKSENMKEMESILKKMNENNDQASIYLEDMKFALHPSFAAVVFMIVWIFVDWWIFGLIGFLLFIMGLVLSNKASKKLKKLHKEFEQLDARFDILRKIETQRLIREKKDKGEIL